MEIRTIQRQPVGTRYRPVGQSSDRLPNVSMEQLRSEIRHYDREMMRAASYVRSLLPKPIRVDDSSDASSPGLAPPLTVEWAFRPSAKLGGDSFGYHWIDDDHFVMYLLDVTGHGPAAALHSVSVLNVLRSQTLPVDDFREPSQVLSALNDTFQMEDFDNMYFTIWYGVYNRRTRLLRYGSGGHPPALLRVGSTDSTFEQHRSGGILIGGIKNVSYETAEREIPAGSVLYLFSDGVYEVPRDDGSMMVFDEFVDLLTELLDGRTDSGSPEPDEIAAVIAGIQDCSICRDDFALVKIAFA